MVMNGIWTLTTTMLWRICCVWGTFDLVPQRDRVVVAKPGQLNPFLDATELTVTGEDEASISRAGGCARSRVRV